MRHLPVGWKMFLLSWLLWGGAMALLSVGNPRQALLQFFVGGPIFGVLVSLAMSLMIAVAQTRAGAREASEAPPLHAKASVRRGGASDEVVLAALEGAGVRRVAVEDGVFTGLTAMNFQSFGEHIRLTPAGEQLEVESWPRVSTTVVDYGRNAENVTRIVAALREARLPLETVQPSAAARARRAREMP